MRRLAALLMLLTLPMITCCSAFDQHWMGTAPPVTANPNAPLAGKWEGSWQSDSTAYEGNLKAVIVPAQNYLSSVGSDDNGPVQKYRAELKMSLFDVVSNEQAVILTLVPALDGKMHFKGKIDRGAAFGGIHQYDGYVDGDVFFCDYTSGKDCGTFVMHRITLENQSQ